MKVQRRYMEVHTYLALCLQFPVLTDALCAFLNQTVNPLASRRKCCTNQPSHVTEARTVLLSDWIWAFFLDWAIRQILPNIPLIVSNLRNTAGFRP